MYRPRPRDAVVSLARIAARRRMPTLALAGFLPWVALDMAGAALGTWAGPAIEAIS